MNHHKQLRGVGDIKTRSGGNAAENLPHKLHMRLCALEMERYRRDQERQVALARAANCQARCEEIEAEVHKLQQAIVSRVPRSEIAPDIKPDIHIAPAHKKPAKDGGKNSIMHEY